MVADADVVTAFARKQSGLLLHAVKAAVHFVLAGAQVAAAGHAAEGKATARRHAGLLRVIAVAVLLAFQQQVAAHVCHNTLAADLRARQARVAAAGQANLLPGIHRGFRPAVAVAQFTAFGRVDVGENAESGAAVAQAETDADIPAATAVAAGQRLGVARRQQIDSPGGIQLHIVGGFQLAADRGDIPLTRHHADIMTRIQRRGKTLRLLAGLAAAGALRPQRHADADKRRGALVIGIHLRALIRLIPRQHRLHPLQRLQPAVALLPHRLNRLHRTVQRRPHHARQRYRQPGGFLLRLAGLCAGIVARVNGDSVARHLNVPRRNHIGGRHRHRLTGIQAHRPIGTAQRTDALALGGRLVVQFLALGRAAYRKPYSAPAEHPALPATVLLVVTVGFHTGRGRDVVPRRQRHLPVRRHRRARHPDVVLRRQRHAAPRQQRPLLGGLLRVTQRVRGGRRQEPLLHRGFFKKIMPAFRRRQQAQVAPRLRRQRAPRFRLRPLQRQVLTRPQAQPFAGVQHRALLRHRLLPVQMPTPRVRAELFFVSRQQAQVPSRRQRQRPRRTQLRRRAVQVAPGAQAQVAAAGHRALHQSLTASLGAGPARLAHRVRQRGQRVQPDVVARRQLQRPARAQLRPVQRDIVSRLQRQPVLRRYQPGLADVGARQRPAAPPVSCRRLPLVCCRGVDDVAVDARQRHRVALYRRAAIGQVAQCHQIQRPAGAQQPAFTVAQGTAAGDVQHIQRRHRAAAVVDVPARAQADAVGHDAAACKIGFIRLCQIQLRRQHRLAADGNVLPPHQAVAQPRHLRRTEAHPQLQAQPALRRRRVVHQLLHLRQLRAHPVQVALPGLAQHRVADITGVERRIAQKTVVVLRIQIQFAQQVGGTQHLRRVGQRRAALHRHRGARRLPQQAAQVAEQRVVHLAEPAQRRVAAYQVAAVAGGVGHEQPVLTGRQRVVA